jgi:hypothetical protein
VLEERREVGVTEASLAALFGGVADFHSSENSSSEAQHKFFFVFFAYNLRAKPFKKACQWVKLRSYAVLHFFYIYVRARPGCKKFVKMMFYVELRIDKGLCKVCRH